MVALILGVMLLYGQIHSHRSNEVSLMLINIEHGPYSIWGEWLGEGVEPIQTSCQSVQYCGF